jgi:GNAT superfamily N-acetyltransferase
MQTLRRHHLAHAEIRRMQGGEAGRAGRFFREAGYPVPLGRDFIAWGAWEREDDLVGCIALCVEHDVSILRGPEILDTRRRRGLGRMLLEAAVPELAGLTCYCVAYEFLVRMYRDAGFRRCGEAEGPDFLRRRIRELTARGWDLVLLIRRGPG